MKLRVQLAFPGPRCEGMGVRTPEGWDGSRGNEAEWRLFNTLLSDAPWHVSFIRWVSWPEPQFYQEFAEN